MEKPRRTRCDGPDHHRLLASCHEAEAEDRVPSHLHQAWGRRDPIQVNLLQGAALRHLAWKGETQTGDFKTSFRLHDRDWRIF